MPKIFKVLGRILGGESTTVNIDRLLKEIRIVKEKLEDIETQVYMLKSQHLEEEELSEDELEELEDLAEETLRDGIPLEEFKSKLNEFSNSY